MPASRHQDNLQPTEVPAEIIVTESQLARNRVVVVDDAEQLLPECSTTELVGWIEQILGWTDLKAAKRLGYEPLGGLIVCLPGIYFFDPQDLDTRYDMNRIVYAISTVVLNSGYGIDLKVPEVRGAGNILEIEAYGTIIPTLKVDIIHGDQEFPRAHAERISTSALDRYGIEFESANFGHDVPRESLTNGFVYRDSPDDDPVSEVLLIGGSSGLIVPTAFRLDPTH